MGVQPLDTRNIPKLECELKLYDQDLNSIIWTASSITTPISYVFTIKGLLKDLANETAKKLIAEKLCVSKK